MTTREQRRSNLPTDKREALAKLDADMKAVRLAKRAVFKGTSYEHEVALHEKRAARRIKRRAAKKERLEKKTAAAKAPIVPRPVRAKNAPTDELKKAFYRSWDWRTLRMEVLKTFGHQCQSCGAVKGDMTVGGDPVKIVVDHIKPLSKFWHLRLDRSNLQVLCDECNQGKGAWDQTDYRPEGAVLWGDEWPDDKTVN